MTQNASQSERARRAARIVLRRVGRFWARRDRQVTTLALAVGLVTALGALGFSWLVDTVTGWYFGPVRDRLAAADLQYWLLPLLPMSGALLVGLITYYFAPEAEGHGVPEVMHAMARRGGQIRPRVAGAKAVASSLTIGSGGAAGTEGPIIQIGAAIGSGIGQWLRVSLADMRILIGCGAAAGIASIFNAPIAGVLFSVEVLLRDVSLRSFVPIIVAAVMSSTLTQAFKGHSEAIFPVPSEMIGGQPLYSFTVLEFGNYLLLGIVCGLVAVTFVRLLYASEDLFRSLPVHRILRPVLGAALMGGVVLLTLQWTEGGMPPAIAASHAAHPDPPAVMGNGYPVIQRSLEPNAYNPAVVIPDTGPQITWSVQVLLILLVAKVLVTCLTLGSGGSGGVFAPSLFVGATTGGAFGLLIQQIPMFEGINPGSYALVGMAAVVAASIHAPLTATLMLFELTRDYKVIVPIMLAAVAALAVAESIEPASIYTLKLLRRGVRLVSGDARLLQGICVQDVPHIPANVVRPEDPVDHLVKLMRTTTANDFAVVDADGQLCGLVLGDDLRTMLLEQEALPLLTVSDVLHDDLPLVRPDETLDIVLEKFAGHAAQSIPIVEDEAVIGFLTRAAVMHRYNQLVAAKK